MNIRLVLWVCLALSACSSLWGQGPISGFLPGRKHTDFAMTYTHEQFRFYFFGDQRTWRPVTTRSANLFLEHGFSDSMSIVITAPYRWIDPVNRGVQDGIFALKYRNHYRRHPWGSSTFLTSVGLSLPLSRYPVATANPIGVRATTFQGRVVSQWQYASGVFLHIQTGLDFRIIPTAQAAVPLLGRLGWAGNHWFLEGWTEFFHTFSSGIDTQVSEGAGSRWWRLGGTLYYGFSPDFGVVVHASRFFNGRNIGQATQLSAGIVYKVDWGVKPDRNRPNAGVAPVDAAVPGAAPWAGGAGPVHLPFHR